MTTQSTWTVFQNSAPRLAKPIPDTVTAYGKVVKFNIPAGTFVDPDGDKMTFAATMKTGAPLVKWVTFDAAEQVFVANPGKWQAATYREAVYGFSVTVTDGWDSTTASFSIIVTGESYTQTAIKFLSISISVAGTLWGLWAKRYRINNFFKARHFKDEVTVVVGETFSRVISGVPDGKQCWWTTG